jgi:hypothetical protein
MLQKAIANPNHPSERLEGLGRVLKDLYRKFVGCAPQIQHPEKLSLQKAIANPNHLSERLEGLGRVP